MRLMPLIVTWVLLLSVAAQDVSLAADGQYAFVLEGALPNHDALTLYVRFKQGQARAAFATGFNSRPHKVDAGALDATDGRLRGAIDVVLRPDPWLPKEGREITCHYTLDASLSDGKVAGRYQGRIVVGGKATAQSGAVRGRKYALPEDGRALRLHARFFKPLLTLWNWRERQWPPKNGKYAFDMILAASWCDNQFGALSLENVVPDYRGYSARITSNTLHLDDDGHLTGAFTFDFDTGSQHSGQAPRYARYRLTVDGWVIGDKVAGTYTCRAGDDVARGFLFLGDVTDAPPPAPSQAYAFMRLHNAMRNDWPVFVNLSMSDQKVHGTGYAPRWTHQIQSLDSELKLEGNRLRGRLRMPIYQCCYKSKLPRFDLVYQIDARIDGYGITGTFTGTDQGKSYEGAITGEIRPRPPVAVTAEDITYCEFRPHRKLHLRLKLEAGEIVEGVVVDPTVPGPDKDDPLRSHHVMGVVENATLTLDGDALRAEASFTVTQGSAKPGDYCYRFEAVVEGEKLRGLWRATYNGEDIYVKSAKLSGRLRTGRD